MLITRQTDYAMRAVLYLAKSPLANIQEIAHAQHLPQVYLAKIVQKLAKANIVTTHRGVGGGISLARAPEKISLLDVMNAIEGSVSLNRCFVDPGVCPRDDYCAVHQELEQIGASLEKMLAKVNFARLARSEAELRVSSRDHRLKSKNSGEK